MRNETGYEKDDLEFDATLARALKHVDAPKSLEMRLMAAAKKEPHRAKVLMFPQKRAWLSGAIAAALVLGVGLGVHEDHERAQREQIAQTQRQFDDAMRVTNRALDQTRERLAKAGLGLGE